MGGFLGAGALASALAGAQRRRQEGRQVAWDNGMEERRLEESVLQRELARKLQERSIGISEQRLQADRDRAKIEQDEYTRRQQAAEAQARAALEERARRVSALVSRGMSPTEAEAVAGDEVAFRERMRPESPRNIDPLSEEGIKAQQRLLDYKRRMESGGGAGGGMGGAGVAPPDPTQERLLRTEFERDASPHREIARGFQTVKSSAGLGTPQGDLALMYGLVRMFDPGSVVREGEMATLQKSSSIPQALSAELQRYIGDGRVLPPEVRKRYLEVAERMANDHRGNLRKSMEATAVRNSQRYGVPSEAVVSDPYEPVMGPWAMRGQGGTAYRPTNPFAGAKP